LEWRIALAYQVAGSQAGRRPGHFRWRHGPRCGAFPAPFLAVAITACIAMVLAEFQGTWPIAILLSRHRDLEKAS